MTGTQRRILLAAILGSSIVFLDSTIVNVALPRIGAELPTSFLGVLEGQTYVVAGYMATLAALLILAGALGDQYGRRRTFAIGLTGFVAASAACGLAPSLEALVLARILQGVAGALLVPGSLAIITATFDGEQRGRAFGIWAAATAAMNLLGPVLGGILVASLSWRVAFLINLPIGAAAVWLTLRFVPETRRSDRRSLDWLGAIVVAIAVGGLSFGAIRGQEKNWTEPGAILALALGAVAAIIFPFLMARRPEPLVPLSLFRNVRFAAINLSTLLIYGALYVFGSFQSLFLQGALGYSPLGSALIGVPVTIQLTLLSARVGTLAARIGARRFLVAGPALMAISMLLWARIPSDAQPWRATIEDPASLIPPLDTILGPVAAMLVFGFGIAMVVAPLTTTLMSSVPVDRAGLGSAINNAISRVGQPLVSAAVFIAVTGSFYAALAAAAPGLDPSDPGLRASIQPLNPPPPGTPEVLVRAARIASTDAFHLAALVSAALLVAGGLVNWYGLRSLDGASPKRGAAPAPSGG
ncbi:MAG TPA: MFS transporter [Candidatus Eisenbacteria bacterium]|nr:MFS transporter [Candidatus Eisenbacteria bacterium]